MVPGIQLGRKDRVPKSSRLPKGNAQTAEFLYSTGQAKSLSSPLTRHKDSNPKKMLNIRHRDENANPSSGTHKEFFRKRLFNIPIENRRRVKESSANTDEEIRPRSLSRAVPQALLFFCDPKEQRRANLAHPAQCQQGLQENQEEIPT